MQSVDEKEERSSAMNMAELQMMATQAQSTANNFTMKTIPETDGNAKVTNTIAEISSM